MTWYKKLKTIRSKGQLMGECNSMAELHERRLRHEGQFFTSSKLIRDAVWQIVNYYSKPGAPRSIFDNSIGSGALVWNANPNTDTIYGLDVDGEKLDLLSGAMELAGFKFNLVNCGIEDAMCSGGVDFALINPPYSLLLESPNIHPYPTNTYGKYGPYKSASSHVYALEQALEYSTFTVAVLPTSFAKSLLDEKKDGLAGVWDLPRSAFKDAGANVATSIVLFRKYFAGSVTLGKVDEDFKFDGVQGVRALTYNYGFELGRLNVSFNKPTITLPVSDNNLVDVNHNGRKIMLRFYCGFMQAKVMNEILDKRIKSNFDNKPLPKGVNFSGQAALDVEVHLMQTDPMKSLNEHLIYVIKNAGGEPNVSPSLIGHIKKRIKRDKRCSLPFGHVYYGGSYSGKAQYKAKSDLLADTEALISPVILKDTVIDVQVTENGGIYTEDDKEYLISQDRLNASFDMMGGADDDWHVRAESKSAEYPELYNQWHKKAVGLGIDKWLDRKFQLDDLIESMIHPYGYVCAWQMGLGKTRQILGSVMLSGVKQGLIIVSPRLIHEFLRQIKTDLSDYISMEDVNVIESGEDLSNLKRYNFISTSRLRMLVDKDKSKNVTFAKALRRRCGLVCVDEAHFISNFNTAQSKAIVALSAKRYILMSGTIIANYPRNLHPILNIFGDSTAYQPWGYHNGKLKPELINDYGHGQRGPKAFMDAFVTIDWCTYEFEDGLIKGAKREIPKISNLELYREALAPFVKRRVINEPEVVKYFDLPELKEHNVFLDWDIDHLSYYVKVAKDFASFWRKHCGKDGEEGSSISSLLPRINAIIKASSRPHVGVDGFGSHQGMTPKDKYAVDLVSKWAKAGEKSILYAASPDTVLRLCGYLEGKGIKCLPYHGGVPHDKRAELLESEFKNGDAMVVIATSGCLNEGENIQNHSSKVLFFERHWSAKTEDQCKARVYRPGQINDVNVYFLHYTGGIDCYIKQMVDFKSDTAKAGIDYASPELFDSEFLHLDRILGEFVESLPELEKQLLELKQAA